MWSLPAGKIEKNENSKDAAVREFKEETDIDLERKNLEFVGLLPRISRDNSKIKGYMYVYEYFTEVPLIPDLENAQDGEEHSKCGYFAIDELPSPLGNQLRKLISIVLK